MPFESDEVYRKALEPFAKAAAWYDANGEDDEAAWYDENGAAEITVADFRNARLAYETFGSQPVPDAS